MLFEETCTASLADTVAVVSNNGRRMAPQRSAPLADVGKLASLGSE
jgi:hypothetical protein